MKTTRTIGRRKQAIERMRKKRTRIFVFVMAGYILVLISLVLILASIPAIQSNAEVKREVISFELSETLYAEPMLATKSDFAADVANMSFEGQTNGDETGVSTIETEETITVTETIETEPQVTEQEVAVTESQETEFTNYETESEALPEAIISADGPSDTYYYQVTDYEKNLMARLVYAEANTEPFEGQVAVAAVVLNRFIDDAFPNSIERVIKQKYQFADISYVSMDMVNNGTCMEAVEAALKGWDPTRQTFENGARFFYAPRYISDSQMRSRQGVLSLTIGNHVFHNEFK